MKPHMHAVSSVRKQGHGKPEDYFPIHQFMDTTKKAQGKVSHRLVLHNTLGCFIAERLFGEVDLSSDDKSYYPRDIAEQHCMEDTGGILSVQAWCREIKLEDWMQNPRETHEHEGSRKIHEFLDEPWDCWWDPRSQAITHSAFGIHLVRLIFGHKYTEIAKQHIIDDLGFIPSINDWTKDVRIKSWMGPPRSRK